MNNKEFSIMDNNVPLWYNYRFSEDTNKCHRHEIFFGVRNRQKSIDDGLVVFLEPRRHNMSEEGVHYNKAFRDMMQREGQKRWMEHYNKTVEDFIARYGKNYL